MHHIKHALHTRLTFGLIVLGLFGCDEEPSTSTDAGPPVDASGSVDASGPIDVGPSEPSDTGLPVDAGGPVGGDFDCEALEEIASYTVVRDARLTLGTRTVRFSTLPSCRARDLGADANYTELNSSGWIDEARIAEDYELQSGIITASVYTGAGPLASGTFDVMPQPRTADEARTIGAAGVIGIKADPTTSAMATPWLFDSGRIEVVDHGMVESVGRRCIELRLVGVGLDEQMGAGTDSLSGRLGCWL